MTEMFQSNGVVVKQLNELLLARGVSVFDIREGCIAVTFTCRNVRSLQHLRLLFDSGNLEKELNEAFCSHFAEKGLKSLTVQISEDQLEQCTEAFVRWSAMSSTHREALLRSAEKLVDKMTVNESLLDKLSFCKRRREAIENAESRAGSVKTLIDIVSRQPNSAFEQFRNALNDTHQTEAADIIIEEHNKMHHNISLSVSRCNMSFKFSRAIEFLRKF